MTVFTGSMHKEDDRECSWNKVLSFLGIEVAITVGISSSCYKTRKFCHVLWKIFTFSKECIQSSCLLSMLSLLYMSLQHPETCLFTQKL